MSHTPDTPVRERLCADPQEVLGRLPEIGRLMVTANHRGATHERIGPVARVSFSDGWAALSGEAHDSRIALSAIGGLIVDRSSVMREQVYPRLQLLRADGSTLCAIVGFGGLAPFDAALAGFGSGEPLDPAPAEPPAERGEVAQDDPGRLPFEAAIAGERAVTIGFARPGFTQAWHGTMEAVKPAMGFINVMRPDFHLHLKAGSVARWHETAEGLLALDADEQPIGLSLAPGRALPPFA